MWIHVDVSLIDLGVTEDFLNGLKCTMEEVLAKFLKAGMSEGCVEVG